MPSVSAKDSRYEPIDVEQHRAELLAIIETVRQAPSFDVTILRHALRRNPRAGSGFFSKGQLLAAYRVLVAAGELPFERETFNRLQTKPVRTQSGIAAVAVLTKPSGCPGRCIFCPDEAAMPRSYLSREPGAQRALRHGFDPFKQTQNRLTALHNIGHPTDKIELLILGGTWGAYSHVYGEWFIQRCLDAMNGSDSGTLAEAQQRNQQARSRCVGLTIETRPDWITPEEILRLRRLGVTRVQLGVQSLDDRILALNQRGHDVAATRLACRLLRAAGFKLLLPWMPNLYGATPESDREDFARLWNDPDMQPDELKIYPCQLLESAELYRYWQAGEYQPYAEETLISLIADVKLEVPRFCRINRVIRDIPSPLVVEGNRNTSLRQDVAQLLKERGQQCQCIRCREIRYGKVEPDQLTLTDQVYRAGNAEEHFLSFNTPEDKIVGFLRLSLPLEEMVPAIPDLEQAAIIREVHVYGQSLEVGSEQAGAAQHIGLGSQLLREAERITREHGFRGLAVISAVGTRNYYADRGFELGELYMRKDLE